MSDGETKDVSSKLTETFPGVESSLLGKRKEDPCVDEEDSDDDWDKDSFDGVEYNPSDDDGDYLDEELERRTRSYHRLVIETKGFFEPSDDFPDVLWAGISPVWDLEQEVKKGITCRDFLANMTSLCLEKYNRRKNKNVRLVRILRANFNPGGRTTYYITFAARESDSLNAPLVEYQAKAVWAAGETFPILCRPTSLPCAS